jgi:hypothetical protein
MAEYDRGMGVGNWLRRLVGSDRADDRAAVRDDPASVDLDAERFKQLRLRTGWFPRRRRSPGGETDPPQAPPDPNP